MHELVLELAEYGKKKFESEHIRISKILKRNESDRYDFSVTNNCVLISC